MSNTQRIDNQPYHRPGLGDALLEAATDVLREGGLTNFSLRKVARRAGVSHAAPYRHFADRAAMLAAVARIGFSELHESFDGIRETDDDLSRVAARIATRYVRFALEDPSLFEVMFLGSFEETPNHGYACVLPRLEAALEPLLLVDRSELNVLATELWSMSHGVAVLAVGGKLTPMTDVGVDALAAQAARTWSLGVLGVRDRQAGALQGPPPRPTGRRVSR